MANLDEEMGLIFDNPWVLLFILIIPLMVFLFIKTRNRNKRIRISSILRLAVFILITLALAGLQITRATEQVNVIYVLDMSDSIPEYMWREALEYIKRQTENMGPRDTSGLIVFGEEPSIEFTPRNILPNLEINSIVSRKGSDISKAIYSAMGSFPDRGESRIVLFSDGLETNGNALQAARIASRSGIRIDTVPLGSLELSNECYIRDVISPFSVRLNQTHEFTVYIESSVQTEGLLSIFRDGEYLGETPVQLMPGDNSYSYTSTLDSKGTHSYEIILNPMIDTIQENNYYNQIIHVTGASSVLYVHQQNQISSSLVNSLKTQLYDIDITDSFSLPDTFSELVQYDAIIFDNVPSYDLSFTKMELIESYVRNTGGGFLMIGGDSSFGVGGYYRSPIERMLPVDMDVSSTMDIPSMSLLMVVDKSGSMSDHLSASQTKLDLVKEAVLAAVDTLNPYYQVACLAFDADYEWILPTTIAGNNREIFTRISSLKTGGGTILYPALEEAYQFFTGSEAAVKHLIILSDGLTEQADFEKISKAMAAKDITISTVSVGKDSDQELMSNIAKWGKGRAYFTADIRNVPQIFASETLIASRGIMINEPFIPVLASQDDILKNIDTDFPALGGFVLTYNKPVAKQLISSVGDNPLLSKMQYGLGRTAAFTSDLKGAWGRDWLTWKEFPKFTAQLMRWLVRPQSQQELFVSIDRQDSRGILTVNALNSQDDFINDLDLKTNFISASGDVTEDDITQVAPGLYEFSFPVTDDGEYFFTVYNENSEYTVSPRTYAFAVPYSSEYIPRQINQNYLENISEETSGSFMELTDFEDGNIYRATQKFQLVLKELWPLLALLALLLFIADLFSRKQVLPDHFLKTLVYRLKPRNRKYNYDELQDIIRGNIAKEKDKYRKTEHWFEQKNESLDISARLYLARKKRNKQK